MISQLKHAEWAIKQDVKERKFGRAEYARLIAEAKGKSYWQLKLLDTPVRALGWDGGSFKALRM